jgi:UDP-N-acetylmuramyl tripeptide synthase
VGLNALAVKVAAARAASALSRRSGRGGTSLPGKLLMRLEPHAIARLAQRLEHGNAVISATNGKTTTAAMVAGILERTGARLVHNRAGANMAGGVAAALLDGARDADTGLFEVDEFWLGQVVDELHPRALLLANLFRDQLDRYGELDTIADRWAQVAAGTEAALVLNADDPIVADLGRDRRVTYFGIADDAMALAEMQHAADAKHCRRCGAPYRYDAVYLGHLGRYHCDVCGATRPEPEIAAHDIALHGVRSARFTLRTPEGERDIALPLPGLYNVYNALGAAALARALGATLDQVAEGLRAVSPAFGRGETLRIGGRELSILLVKNPAGANEVLRTLVLEDGDHDLFAVLNDNIADGRDVSWIWDADFEVLAPRVRRATCSGTRAAEMALRLKYAGVPTDRIVVEPGLDAGLDRALAATGPAPTPLYALPTYTAMLALREALVARGAASSSFAPPPSAAPGTGPLEGTTPWA